MRHLTQDEAGPRRAGRFMVVLKAKFVVPTVSPLRALFKARVRTNADRQAKVSEVTGPDLRPYCWAISSLIIGFDGVPMEGVEPTHPYGYQILSLARLPIPPHRRPRSEARHRWKIQAECRRAQAGRGIEQGKRRERRSRLRKRKTNNALQQEGF